VNGRNEVGRVEGRVDRLSLPLAYVVVHSMGHEIATVTLYTTYIP